METHTGKADRLAILGAVGVALIALAVVLAQGRNHGYLVGRMDSLSKELDRRTVAESDLRDDLRMMVAHVTALRTKMAEHGIHAPELPPLKTAGEDAKEK